MLKGKTKTKQNKIKEKKQPIKALNIKSFFCIFFLTYFKLNDSNGSLIRI